MEVVPHQYGVNVPPQLFDKSSMAGFVKLLPMLLNVMEGFVVWATNLYHTSYTTDPVQSGAVIVAAERVAPYIFPPMFVQLVPEVNVIAAAQLSLGSVTQMLKPYVPAVI